MPLILDAAAGTEKWIQWAKARLGDLNSLRVKLGLPKMTKAWVPESGTLVWLVSSDFRDVIRITGGFEGRYLFNLQTDPEDLFMQARGPKHARAKMSIGLGNNAAWWSRDDSTVAWFQRNDADLEDVTWEVVASRNNLPTASVVTTAFSGGSIGFRMLAHTHLQGQAAWTLSAPGSAPMIYVTNDGKTVYVKAGTPMAVKVFSVGTEGEGEETKTTLTEVSVPEVPSFVTDFYSLRGHVVSAELSPGNIVPLLPRGGYYLAVTVHRAWDSGIDFVREVPVTVVEMPFVQSITVNGQTTTFVVGVRWELRRFNLTTKGWDLVYGRTENGVFSGSIDETQDQGVSPDGFSLGLPVQTLSLAETGALADRTEEMIPTSGPGLELPLRVIGPRGAQKLALGDTEIVSGPAPGDDGTTFITPMAIAPKGALVIHTRTGPVVNTQYWYGAWGRVDATFDNPRMSPDGTKLWIGNSKYYENGVLVYEQPWPPLPGALGVQSVVAWSYKEDAVKAMITFPVAGSWVAKVRWNAEKAKLEVVKSYSAAQVSFPTGAELPDPPFVKFSEADAAQDEYLIGYVVQ